MYWLNLNSIGIDIIIIIINKKMDSNLLSSKLNLIIILLKIIPHCPTLSILMPLQDLKSALHYFRFNLSMHNSRVFYFIISPIQKSKHFNLMFIVLYLN